MNLVASTERMNCVGLQSLHSVQMFFFDDVSHNRFDPQSTQFCFCEFAFCLSPVRDLSLRGTEFCYISVDFFVLGMVATSFVGSPYSSSAYEGFQIYFVNKIFITVISIIVEKRIWILFFTMTSSRASAACLKL